MIGGCCASVTAASGKVDQLGLRLGLLFGVMAVPNLLGPVICGCESILAGETLRGLRRTKLTRQISLMLRLKDASRIAGSLRCVQWRWVRASLCRHG